MSKKLVFQAVSTLICLIVLSTAGLIESSAASSHSKSSTAAGQSRGGPVAAATGVLNALSTIGGLIPGLITNVAPLMLLFGLGALMMPGLGLGGAMNLLRESRRR